MKQLRLFLPALLLAAGQAGAQTPGEISFWESVRDSKNPTELQAYLQAFPNGVFAPLARARLAALGARPAAAPARPSAPAVASTAPSAVSAQTRMPQAGDTWTYRLSYPRLRGQWGQTAKPPGTHVATVTEASESTIIDQVSVDGGTPVVARHAKGSMLLQQGASIFSPYLLLFEDLPASGRLRNIVIADPGCTGTYLCEAKASIAGRETVTVPAGSFQATRIIVTQEWRPASGSVGHAAMMAQYQGGRTLTVWYVPEIKRAVKYSSRLVAGDVPPMDANFDLELVSYKVQ